MRCSDNYKDLKCEELLELFLNAGVHLNKRLTLGQHESIGEHTWLQHISVCAAHHYFHQYQYGSSGRDELLQKLEHAIANSITVVIASVQEDKLPSYQDPDREASQTDKGAHSL